MNHDEFTVWAQKHDWIFVSTNAHDDPFIYTLLTPRGDILKATFRDNVLLNVK